MVLSPVLAAIFSVVLVLCSTNPSASIQAVCLSCTLVVALDPDLVAAAWGIQISPSCYVVVGFAIGLFVSPV